MVVYKYGDPEANIVLIQPVGDHDVHDIENEVSEIMKRTSLEFRMIAVKVDRWNQDLSPWRAPAVFGNEDFGEVCNIRTVPDVCRSYCTGKDPEGCDRLYE